LKAKRVILVLIFVVALSLFGVTAVGASGSQNWFLGGVANHPAGTAKTMFKEGNGDPGGSVSILPGVASSQLWLADEVAQADVTFPDGAWAVMLASSNWASSCQVEIGYYAPGTPGTFTKFDGTATGLSSYAGGIIKVVVQSSSVTVDEGNYLALKVTNTSGTAKTVTTTGGSYVVSPTSDPGYPLPEMTAGILFGIGLASLGGFVFVKKRKAALQTDTKG
jgi:LPXTG-motif cell wall-anchored protein